jgi:hypothetical protein
MSTTITHKTTAELEAALDTIRQSPRDAGVLHMIVRRPEVGRRDVLERGELDVDRGLVGDNWRQRTSKRTPDGLPHPEMQINIMNSRVVDLIAQQKERWPLAGDQLFIDLDLTGQNLPPGTRLRIGSAVLEVTAQPHTGCAKFIERFGADAAQFVNSTIGRELNLRGINARVVVSGTICVNDVVLKVHGA